VNEDNKFVSYFSLKVTLIYKPKGCRWQKDEILGWNDTDEGNPKYSKKKIHSSVMLSTTNNTCTGLASNLGFRGDRPEP